MTSAVEVIMVQKFFVMQLHPSAEEEYRRRHNPIWKELEETLRAHGVRRYSISLHPGTRQLYACAEVEDEARWNAIAETAVCRRWWDYMADLMEVNEDRSPQVIELQELFNLESMNSDEQR